MAMMDQARFHELAEAYGGDLARWPGAQRDAARAFAQARPELADAALAAARGLDAALAADEVGAPTSQLTQAIVAAGMEHRRPARAWRWAAGLGLGLGLAAAGAAGVAFGLTVTPPAVVRFISGARPSAEPADEISSLVAPLSGPDDA